MDVVRGEDLITLAPTALNNSFIVVVTQFGFRRNYSLPAPKRGPFRGPTEWVFISSLVLAAASRPFQFASILRLENDRGRVTS